MQDDSDDVNVAEEGLDMVVNGLDAKGENGIEIPLPVMVGGVEDREKLRK